MDEKVLKTILNYLINDFSMLFNRYFVFLGGLKDTILQSPLGIDAREHRNLV